MEGMIVNYVKPELLVLIPVLWLVADMVKKSKFPNRFIPLLIGGIGTLLAGLYVFSRLSGYSAECIAGGVFASVTQGVLCAGGSVYAHEIIKNLTKKSTTNSTQDVDKTE